MDSSSRGTSVLVKIGISRAAGYAWRQALPLAKAVAVYESPDLEACLFTGSAEHADGQGPPTCARPSFPGFAYNGTNKFPRS